VVALQWHVNLKSVTNRTHGPLVGGLVINKPKWDSMPEDVRALIQEQINSNYEGDNLQVRKDDVTAFKKLLTRGFTANNYSPEGEKEYQEVAKKARESLAGRVYSKELLERVMQVARGGAS
jgi:TRAP-type C4-dicarboxylate transport system substrate-binding protein